MDERMLPYFGRHSAKIVMKGKPIKDWYTCSYEQLMFYGGARLEE